MPKTFLVDAHNALFRLWPEPPTSGDAVRKAVVARAKDAVRRRGDAGAVAHLVFDTARDGRQRAGTHGKDGAVSWSYAAGSADEEIVRLVREHEGRHGGAAIAVVTDDRELRGRVEQLGAEVLRVHEWFAGEDAAEERSRASAGPPMTAADFGFSRDAIDLDEDPEGI